MSLIYFLLIGLIAGWLAGKVMKGKSFGLIGNMVVGCVGAVLGGFLFSQVGMFAHTLLASLVVALIGAIVLLWVVGLIKK